MSECTKGKMTLKKYRKLDAVFLDDKCIIKMAFPEHAKELVRRWNAFEDGGIVEELRTAVDEEYVLRLKIEKQRDKMEKALEDCTFLADTAIASTPTGDLRNKLTEINILRLAALAKS